MMQQIERILVVVIECNNELISYIRSEDIVNIVLMFHSVLCFVREFKKEQNNKKLFAFMAKYSYKWKSYHDSSELANSRNRN